MVEPANLHNSSETEENAEKLYLLKSETEKQRAEIENLKAEVAWLRKQMTILEYQHNRKRKEHEQLRETPKEPAAESPGPQFPTRSLLGCCLYWFCTCMFCAIFALNTLTCMIVLPHMLTSTSSKLPTLVLPAFFHELWESFITS